MKDLLLLHGALGDGSQLTPLKAALDGRLRCHLVELEGHGRTPSQHRYSIARFAGNVRAYMSGARLQRASIFGYSLGGYVALALASEAAEVESVATLATKLAWTPEAAASEIRKLDPAKIRAKVPAFAALLERRHADAGGWDLVLTRTAELMTSLGSRPIVDDAMLARIRQPAKLMVGDRDTVVSVDETSRAANLLARGELTVLPDTAHPFEQVQVETLADELHAFIG